MASKALDTLKIHLYIVLVVCVLGLILYVLLSESESNPKIQIGKVTTSSTTPGTPPTISTGMSPPPTGPTVPTTSTEKIAPPISMIDGREVKWDLITLTPNWAESRSYKHIEKKRRELDPKMIENPPVPILLMPVCFRADDVCKEDLQAESFTYNENGFSGTYRYRDATVLQYVSKEQFQRPSSASSANVKHESRKSDSVEFAELEDGAKLVVTRFGISYQYFILCNEPHCVDRSQATAIANGLVVVSGQSGDRR